MAGGGSFSSDQKFTTLTADGSFKTITGGSTNLGPCRVTYIQAAGVASSIVKLHDRNWNRWFSRTSNKFWNRRLRYFGSLAQGIRFNGGDVI